MSERNAQTKEPSAHACQGLGQMEYHARGRRFTRWTCACGVSGEAATPAEAANDWHAHAEREPRCRCTHGTTLHWQGVGRCSSTTALGARCGCLIFQQDEPTSPSTGERRG